MDKRDEEDAANTQASVVGRSGAIELVNRESELSLVCSPSRECNVKLDKGEENVNRDEGKVDNLAQRAPVQGIVWV